MGSGGRSPSGGLHLYFPSDPAREQRSWSRGTSHLDFRGVGGYIIAPPSRIDTANGLRRYEVIAQGRAPRPFDADAIRKLLTPTPPALPRIPAGMRPRPGASKPESLAEWVSQLPEGNRNSGLFWAACRLAETGFTESEMRAVLEPAATSIALEPREIASTIRSASRTAQLAPSPADQTASPQHAQTGMRR